MSIYRFAVVQEKDLAKRVEGFHGAGNQYFEFNNLKALWLGESVFWVSRTKNPVALEPIFRVPRIKDLVALEISILGSTNLKVLLL